MKPKTKKIGEILLENGYITKDILAEAIGYQSKFGVGLTQYLIAYGYINEEELARSISEQFHFPYLPLRVYNIPEQIISLVPVDIAEKYWLIPIDKVENILTLVMSNPLDEEAIKAVEKTTRCKAQPFIGILSDIIKAIEKYYHVVIEDKKIKEGKTAPLFIDVVGYKGFERRRSIRIKARIDIHFPAQNTYQKTEIKDVSAKGFLFESGKALPMGAYVALEINLPEEFSLIPIAAVVQVARIVRLANGKFDIGARLLKIPKEDMQTIIAYAGMYGKQKEVI